MKTFLLTTILLSVFTVLQANKGYDVTFKQPQSDVYQVTFNVLDYSLKNIEINGMAYSKIVFNNSVNTNKKGFAELPIISTSVQLSANKNVTLRIINSEYVEYPLESPLLPSRGTIYRNQNPELIPYEIDPASFVDAWYPSTLANSIDPYIIKDARGTNIYVNPFQYNAVRKVLRVYTKIEVELFENNEPVINPLPSNKGANLKELDGIYQSVFINYQQNRDALAYGQYGDILVICTSRDETAIEPYILWKKEKGFNVSKLVVATGTNVKTTIQNAYTANNNIFYVLLVGDWADIKSDLGGGANAPMDPQLGCVVGTDNNADICIGRISASTTAAVTIQVNKMINYEKNPSIGGTWYSKALSVASDEGDDNGDDSEVDQEHTNHIYNSKLDPFTYDGHSTAYEPSGTIANVSTAINNGVGIINYCGHGSNDLWVTTGFSNTDVNSLDNKEKLPIILSVACVNGTFHESSDCFAEAWMKKDQGGAVFTLMSTINQPWQPPMRGQDYMNDIIVGGHSYTGSTQGINTSEQRTMIGSIVFNAFVLMLSESSAVDDINTVQTWTAFGDPAMQIRTATPLDITLSNEVPMVGVAFTTNANVSGNPVKDAMVCISQNGVYFSGISDASGNVTINHTLDPGAALLVVTAFNTQTIYRNITVAAANGPWITYQSNAVNDANGNNNNTADFGENVILQITNKNVGVSTANGVIGTLTSSNTYVTITDGTNSYGNINVNTTATGNDDFSVSFANNIPDQENIQFAVSFTDGTDTWNSQFALRCNAPSLNIEYLNINDAAGNNNGLLDAGETFDINISNLNIGHSNSPASTCVLTSTSPYITINTTSISPGIINATGNVSGAFNVTLDSGVPSGTTIDFVFTLTAGEYTATKTVTMPVGLLIETWESGTFTTYGWQNTSTNTWFITTSNPYAGNDCAQSGDIGNLTAGESILTINLNVLSADNVSFYKKVSSEPVSYGSYWDYLEFLIDGTSKAKWAGEIPWAFHTYPVTAGQHELKWRYKKDAYVDEGSDCAWLDDITLPPHNMATIIDFSSANVADFSLQVYPNPIQSVASIAYAIPNDNETISIQLVNMLGQETVLLDSKQHNQGNYTLYFNSENVPSGMYFCKLTSKGKIITTPIVIQ